MKNLKKILMALVLVALLVSSVVTIAVAEASYTGNVETAQQMLDAAYEADAGTGSTADAKAPVLLSLYNYLITVNPADEGYDEIRKAYNDMTFKVMHDYFEEYGAATNNDARSAALTKVYTYKTATPVILGNGVNDVVYSHSYKCENCGATAAFKPYEFYNGITDEIVCPGTCSADEQEIVYDTANAFSYLDFEVEFNSAAFSMVENLISYLFSLEEIENNEYVSYYQLLDARKEVAEFLKSVAEKEYEFVESALYTGSVSEVSDILKGTTASSDFDKLKSTLAAAYSYLVKTPVNPTSDEYFTFINKYSALCDALIASLASEVDACTTPEEKVEVLASFRAYLVGDGENAGTQISEKVVLAYNALRLEIIDEYKSADDVVEKLQAIDLDVSSPEYSNVLDGFIAALDAADAAIENGEDITDIVKELYSSYVAVFAYDPKVEEYAGAVSRYLDICAAYIKAEFVDPFEDAKLISEKLEIVISFNKFVSENPISENAVDTYNALRETLVEKLAAYVDLIDDVTLPEYVAPEKKPTMASEPVLYSLLETLTDSVDVYNNAAEGDEKLAALEDVKFAAKEIREYILGSDLDSEATYYADFVEKYNAARESVANLLIAIVDDAAEDAKLSELEALGAFLTEVPLSKDTIDRFNGKVDELVIDPEAAAEMKILTVYHEIDVLIDEILFSEDVNEIRELAAELFAYSTAPFDITDTAYSKYLSDSAEAMNVAANAIHDDIIAALNASDAADDAALVNGYLEYVDEVYCEIILTKTVDAFNSINTTFASTYNQLVESNENAAYIFDAYEYIASFIEAFDSAADLDARAEIFTDLFTMINDDFFNTAFIMGDSYDEIMNEYARVLLAFENELIASITSDLSAYDLAMNLEFVSEFINELPFSKNVIDNYNSVYASVSSADFGKYVDKFDAQCPVIEKYVSPEGWNYRLQRINIALEGSVDEDGLVEEYFKVAYNILSGLYGIEGPQVIDFGVAGFLDTITAFDNVKQNIIKTYADKTEDAKTVDEKGALLDELGAFIDKYPFSKKLVDAFNGIRKDIRDAYNQDSNASFALFQKLVDKIYAQLESCPINEKYLSDYERSLYRVGESLLSAAEFCIVENYLEVAMGIGGANALIYQNIAVDELNASIGSFALSNYNEQILVEANLKLAFNRFIDKFDAEIASLSDADKKISINSTGAILVSKAFPSDLLNLYNIKYADHIVKPFVAQNIAEATVDGSIDTYADYLEGVMKADDVTDVRTALTALVEYVNGHKFSTENTSGEMVEKLESVKEALAKATQEQIDILDKLVSSDETSYAVEHNYDYENGKCNFSSAYNTGDATAKVVTDPKTGEKYAELNANTAASLQYLLAINDASQGLVLDFDIMSEGDLNFLIYFYGNKKQVKAIEIIDGVIQGLDSYPNYSADAQPIKPTPGQWMHITVAFDIQSQTQEIYIDYVSLGKKNVSITAADFQTSAGGRVKPYAGKSAVCIDNFKAYHGTAYRTLGKLSTMDDDAKFALNIETLLNEDARATERYAAYLSASALEEFITDKSADLLVQLKNFDISEIKAEAQESHLAKIKELVDNVNIDGINTSNTAAAQSAMSMANAYIEANRMYIDQMDPLFRGYAQTLSDASDKIVWLANLGQYIESIKKFHRATSYASLTKHLENVTHYYELCELYDVDKVTMASSDPVAQAFAAEMLKDAGVIALVPNFTFAAYYEEYIPARLAAQTNYENSVKVVDCIEFIDALIENKDQLSADAYKAALLAVAEEEFEYIDPYMTIVRKVINSGNYDVTYEGLEHAIEVFELLDPIFFAVIQENHFNVIKGQLDKYAQTNSYIERAGICTFLRNYIAENEVDMSSAEGRNYIYALEIYEEELEGYMQDYEAILAENTEAFLGIVKKMQSYVTYSKLKPLYDEAIAKYYYNMNVDSEEVKAAVAIFAEYELKIQAWEENSAMLLGYAKDLNTARRMAQKYRALVRCSNYVAGADAGVEGVADALELYAEKLAEYTESIEPTIKETVDANNVVSALRTNRLSATVLAIANSIINK